MDNQRPFKQVLKEAMPHEEVIISSGIDINVLQGLISRYIKFWNLVVISFQACKFLLLLIT